MSYINNRSENKRIARNTMILYFRMLSIMLVSLYTSRIVIGSLGIEDYGIYNVVGGVIALFSILSNSLSAAVSRFFTFELGRNNINRLRIVFSSSMIIMFVFTLIIIILAEIFGLWMIENKLVIPAERIISAKVILHTSIIAFSFNILQSTYRAAIIAYEKMAAFAYFGVFETIAKLAIAISLSYSTMDKLEWYGYLHMLLSIICAFCYYIYGRFKLEGCKYILSFDRTIFVSIAKYSSWSMLGVVVLTGYTQGYNILLNMFFGPIVNGARGIAVQVQSAVQSFSSNFQASLNPQIIKNYASDNKTRMYELVFASSRYSYYLMLLISLPVILETEFLLNVWLVDVPAHTVNFVRIMLVIITFDVLSGSLIISQSATGDLKIFQIVTCGIMLLSLPISYICLKIGGIPESIYMIYGVFTIFAHIGRVMITCPKIGMPISSYVNEVIMNLIKVTPISVIIPIALYNVLPESISTFIVICIACALSVLISIYFIGLKQSEREFCVRFICKVIKK